MSDSNLCASLSHATNNDHDHNYDHYNDSDR
jgi:hypothetical protein